MTNSDPVRPNRRILVVDDNEGIHRDLRQVLAGDSAQASALDREAADLFQVAPVPSVSFEIDSAFQGQEGLELLKRSLAEGRPYAMAFVDIRMPPGWDGVETITHFWKICPDLQVVICTAYSDYSWDALATRLTALTDSIITPDFSEHASAQIVPRLGYSENLIILKKPFDNVVVRQIAHALTRKWSVTRQAKLRVEDLDRLVAERTASLRAANEQFQLSERRFAKAFGASPIPLALQTGADRRFVDANARFRAITGYSHAELVGHTPTELKLWPEESTTAAWITQPPGAVGLREFACQFRTRSGEIREALVSTEDLELAPVTHRLLILQDISERVRLENRLRQAQKLESIGQLAGGIAHDFNNVLAVILGNLSLAKLEVASGSDAFLALQAAEDGAQRARELTTQLLTFSKGGKPVKSVTDLGQVIRDSTRIALRGSHSHCSLNLDPNLWPVLGDALQLGQVFNNLVLNAHQSKTGESQIYVEARNRTITQADAQPIKEGNYVQVVVQDQGGGIDAEQLPKIFDPYFTTSKPGHGLGLAVIYSIIKNHQGSISAESDPGVSTTFTILLPAVERPSDQETPAHEIQLPASRRRILVMDDEEMVRTLLSRMLTRVGYEVESAADGAAAIKLYTEAREKARPFDLVIMDLTVPNGMGGEEAVQRLLEIDPQVKAVVSSGYSENPIMADHKAYGFSGVVHKPYTFEQLSSALERVLKY